MFKDRFLNDLLINIVQKKATTIKLAEHMDLLTHSYIKERYLEMLVRALEIPNEFTKLEVRLI